MFSFSKAAFSDSPKAALSSFCENSSCWFFKTFCPSTNRNPLAPSPSSAKTSAPAASPLPEDCRMTTGLAEVWGICFGSDIVFPVISPAACFSDGPASFSDVAAKVPDVGTVSRLSEAAVFSLSESGRSAATLFDCSPFFSGGGFREATISAVSGSFAASFNTAASNCWMTRTFSAPASLNVSAMRGWWVKYSKDLKNREN